MTHFSPASLLLWAVLAVLMQVFLVSHLWKFDRFRCVRWGGGRQPGAFKRVMTYSYLATLPLLVVFSVSFTAIKYQEGYIVVPAVPLDVPSSPYTLPPPGTILPKPYFLWSAATQRWIFPLYLVLAFGWALEMVTHLEELNFWLFLLNQGPNPREWFGSPEFKTWAAGSVLAVVSMPLVCTLTRHNPLTCEAWVFFVGSVGSTTITAWFLHVLWHFPAFLARVRAEGAPPVVLRRLARFNELNVIRVLFRALFSLPLLALALDGVRHGAHHPVNESALGTDLLTMLGGVGCMFSSGLTLLIFFPRSGADEAAPPRTSVAGSSTLSVAGRAAAKRRSAPGSVVDLRASGLGSDWSTRSADFSDARSDAGTEVGGETELDDMPHPLRRGASGRGAQRDSLLHPYIAQYTSPIDLLDYGAEDARGGAALA